MVVTKCLVNSVRIDIIYFSYNLLCRYTCNCSLPNSYLDIIVLAQSSVCLFVVVVVFVVIVVVDVVVFVVVALVVVMHKLNRDTKQNFQ